MRRITIRVRPGAAMAAFDVLLPWLPAGLHTAGEGPEATVLVALGEPHQLTPVGRLAEILGDLAVEPPLEEEAGDLAAELQRLRPSWEIRGRVVVRSPHSPPAPPGLIDVVIDRSMGFGSGAHPTTRMVLDLLLDLEPGGAFADLGCGAGVLPIAAAKLGWDPVVGVDFSPGSVSEARDNAERNGVVAAFEVADLRVAEIPPARITVANVSEGDVHARLARHDWDGVEALILSGVRVGVDLEPTLERYAAAGFAERDRRVDGMWAAVTLERARTAR